MAALVRFDHSGQWAETLVCSGLIQNALSAHGIVLRQTTPGSGTDAAGEAGQAARLLYLKTDVGWLGLLVDQNESASVPAAMQVHCSEADESFVHESLPAREVFIDTLLGMLGEADSAD